MPASAALPGWHDEVAPVDEDKAGQRAHEGDDGGDDGDVVQRGGEPGVRRLAPALWSSTAELWCTIWLWKMAPRTAIPVAMKMAVQTAIRVHHLRSRLGICGVYRGVVLHSYNEM
jgi:hypothetical protein